MKRDRMLELRVLTGTHAGARVLLPDAPQVLGSADDCDLILCDDGIAPQHARLERLEDGSALLHVLDRDLPPIHIRPGQGAEVGQVRISVEEADAPWNEDVPIADQPPPEGLPLAADEGPAGAPDAGGPQASGLQPPATPRPPVRAPARAAGGWWQVAGAALLVSAGSYLVFPNSFIYFGVLHGIAAMLVLVRLTAGWGRWLWLAGALASGQAAEWSRVAAQWPLPPWVALWIDPSLLQALQATLAWTLGWMQSALPFAGTLVGWLVPLAWVGWGLGLVVLLGLAAVGHLWWSRRAAARMPRARPA